MNAACIASFALLGFVSSATLAAPVGVDPAEYERTRERNDRDGGRAALAAADCLSGRAELASQCAVAYARAIEAERYEDALRYAAVGCERHRNAADCRRAARVPLTMGNASVAVPRAYAGEIRRLANFVCLSGARIEQPYAGDATGRECANLARHFILAKDPEYAPALKTEALAYYEAVYDPGAAARFFKASCRRLDYRGSCGMSRLASGELREAWAQSPARTSVAGQGSRKLSLSDQP